MKTRLILIPIVLLTFLNPSIFAQDDVLKIAEEMPSYGDCSTIVEKEERKTCSDKAIYQFLSGHIIYPDSAQIKGIEGTVVLEFIVDATGKINDAKVVKDIGEGCGEEALRVLGLMDDWTPGKHKGKLEKVKLYLPIKFKINEIPVTIKTEKFEHLRDLFCTNYLTDFIRLDVIHAMADDELELLDLCQLSGIKNGIGKLKLTLIHNDRPKFVESEDGTFSTTMRNFLKETQAGDVIELEYEMLISLDGENDIYKDIYKSVIVE